MWVQYVAEPGNVVPFPGVKVRRVLVTTQRRNLRLQNAHPPAGRFGKGYHKACEARLEGRAKTVVAEFQFLPEHEGVDWKDLEDHQQIAYWCLSTSHNYGIPLSKARQSFCWYIAAKPHRPGCNQRRQLKMIWADVDKRSKLLDRIMSDEPIPLEVYSREVAVFCYDRGNGCLSEWERDFCQSMSKRRQYSTARQRQELRKILGKVRRACQGHTHGSPEAS